MEKQMLEKDSLIEEINTEFKNIQNELLKYKTEIKSLQNYITHLEANTTLTLKLTTKKILYMKKRIIADNNRPNF